MCVSTVCKLNVCIVTVCAASCQGRDDEAKELIKRALATVESVFGPSHPVAEQLRTILGPGGWGAD